MIGLVDDFNFQSLHHEIEPLLLYINKHPYYAEHLSIRMQPGNIATSVATIQKHWKAFHPDKPLEYRFLNDDLNRLYGFEIKISRIFSSLTIIAIILSAFGLLGLSSFLASKRSKEMGIRKVFGANRMHILTLQFREYLVLVILANVIGIPFCWYWATDWFNNFAHHISISPFILSVTFVCSLALTVAAVSSHSLRVARQNPINSIRHE